MPKQKVKTGGAFVDLAAASVFKDIKVGGAPGGGPPALLGVSQVTNGGSVGSSVVVNKPAGVVSGSLILFFVTVEWNNGVEAFPTSSGFTELGRYYGSDGNVTTLVVLAKIAGGSEPATYTISGLSSAFITVLASAWSNTGPVSGMVAVAGSANIGPSLTVPNDGIAVYGFEEGSAPSAGFTLLDQRSGSGAAGYTQYKSYPAGGATGTQTVSGSAYRSIGVVINPPDYTDYTLELTDDGKVVEMPGSQATILTIPANASVAFPVGASVKVRRLGTGVVTLAPAGGVTLTGVTSLAELGDEVILHKRAANVWHASLSSGKTLATQAELDAVIAALSIIGTNNQTGTAYTLALADAGKVVELNNAAAITLTIPTDATVNFPVGTVIEISQEGAGQVAVAPAGGVTLTSTETKRKLYGQYATGALRKRAANDWRLVGDLVA